MKKFMFFAALLGFAVACGGNDSKKNENDEALTPDMPAIEDVEVVAPETVLEVVDVPAVEAPTVDVNTLEVSTVTITPVSATADEKAAFTAEKELKVLDAEAKTFKDAANAKPAVRVNVETSNTNLTVAEGTITAIEL